MTYPGLGGQQPPPQNAAPAQQLVPGITPGTTGVVVASRVIIIGTGGELLVYSPTAAAGNLIASIAAANATDQFGDHIIGGVSSYQSGFATALNSGEIDFYTGTPVSGWTFQGSINGSSIGAAVLNFTSLAGAITVPQPDPGGFPLPNDTNSGTGWVSGERAFMNTSWIAPINALYNALVAANVIM